MKLYKTIKGIVLEKDNNYWVLENENWDLFVNDDDLYSNLVDISRTRAPCKQAGILKDIELQAPIQGQEIWACGVTYNNSKLARQAESKEAGGGTFYARVYRADRPEIFFKATAARTAGPNGTVRIRADSDWNVPEPELTLMLTSSGKIVGYTIGNDVSSRSIESENPLYLPQAKTYDRSASIGPGIYVPEKPLGMQTRISMQINREGEEVFQGNTTLSEMKRTPEELVAWLFRECNFPHGCLLMTGTGIVPFPEFTLHSGDEIRITIDHVGTLINLVE